MTETIAYHESPYGVIGTDVTAQSDPLKALEQGGLTGWDVRLDQATVSLLQDDGVETVDIPGKFAITRNDPDSGRRVPMGGVFSKSYGVTQNEVLAEFMQAVIDTTRPKGVRVGKAAGGNRVFVQMELPDELLVGGVDKLGLAIVCFNSFDGSSSLLSAITPTRLSCMNQQRATIRGAQWKHAIRHTGDPRRRVQEVRSALSLSWKYVEAFEQEAQKMIERELAEQNFRDVLAEIFPRSADDKPRAQAVTAARDETILALDASGPANDGIRGTRWGAYQAITEYLDHYMPVRAVNADTARAERVILGGSDAVKLHAWDVLAAV